uniref:Uncharacterized protein n=1 Tax=viral metagenome TaxID=1070528 RepID=A0A6C0BRA1_9ZZZZ
MSTNTKLKLGDIIKIEAPGNTDLNGKDFIIDYIDKNVINLLSSDIEYTLKILDNIITDKSIEKIILLSRSEKEGFIKQNNLVINTWIDLNFGGDLPETFTGKITNIENDMMEVTRYPQTDQIIYIDFAYSGIPRDLEIKKPFIEIRESPKKISEINLPQQELDEGEDIDEFINEDENILLGDALTNLNDFVLGEELEDLVQYKKVSTKEKRFGLDIQEQDIIDDMISKLSDKEKNEKNINAIHKLVNYFKVLRKEYSNYDINGNVSSIRKIEPKYKPLVNSLCNLSDNFNYMIPVIKMGRNVYDIESGIEGRFDVINKKIGEDLTLYNEFFDIFHNNDSTLNETSYNTFVRNINSLIPTYKLNDVDDVFCKEVNTNIECLINNYTDLTSSTINNTKLDDNKFTMMRFNKQLNKNKLEEGTFKDEQRMLKQKLTDGEEICINSFIILPKQVIQKSTNMKLINILEKIKRHEVFFNNYVKIFNKHTSIKEHNIKSLSQEIDYDFDDINYITLDETILTNHTLKNDLYEQFLNKIIPKTSVLITKFEEDLERALSFNEIIKFLEPFLIYHETLTFKQYEMIMKLIDKNRKLYVKRLKNMHDTFYEYRKKLHNDNNEKYGYKEDKNKYKQFFNYRYINLDEINYTEHEIIVDSLNKDYSNTLISTLIDIDLMNDENNNMLIEYFKKKYNKDKKGKEDACDPTIVVAKRYRSVKELEKDNGVELYFDSDYDDTVYELNSIYEKEKLSLSPNEYKQFLKKKLTDINGINEDNIDYIVNTIIDGKKKVIDGQYAVREKYTDEAEDDDDSIKDMYYAYYKREGLNWVYDNELTDKNKFKLLLMPECDIKSGCIDNEQIVIKGEIEKKTFERRMKSDDNCIDKNDYLMNLKKKVMKKMMTEFDHTYDYSTEKMKQYIQDKIDTYSLELSDRIRNYYLSELKYNNYLYQLSLTSPEQIDIPTSPYQTLLDKILIQDNIYKKNSDILLFCKNCTRDAVNDESRFWKYCSISGVQLLPIFRYELAFEYIKDTSFYKENYKKALNRIRKEYGKLSDDGDKWVSEEGGWTIVDVEDFDGEQYSPSGFKEVTESIEIDESNYDEDNLIDEVSNLLENKKDILEFKQLYSNSNSKIVYELVTIFIKELGISLNQETINFIIKYVNKSFEIYFYKEDLSDTQRKKVNLILTLSVTLLAIQLKVNNVVSTKTVKTCKTSFTGFPTFPNDGTEGVQYISCIAYTLRTKKTSLFKIFNKVKEEDIVNAIISYTNDYILILPEIQSQIYEFHNMPKVNINKEVSIDNWTRFLPPVISFTVKTETNVSSEFLNDILSHMKKGNYDAIYNVNILSGKTIKLSYNLFSSIQKIISKKTLLLQTKRGDYFMENSCCDEDYKKTPLEYFNDIDPAILNYHDMILFNSEIMDVVQSIYRPKMISLSLLKKPINFNTSNEKDINENNIYQAIIHYCKIGDVKNVKRYSLRNVCKDINITFNSKDTIIDKIDKLKIEGYIFNYNNLTELMQIVNSGNRIHVKPLDIDISISQKLRILLESDSFFENEEINDKLYTILDNYNSYLDSTSEQDNINLQTYIYDIIALKLNKLSEFFQNNITYSQDDVLRFNKFFNDIITFNNVSEIDDYYESEYYHKNIDYIKKIVKNIANLFPSIIINESDVTKYKHPKSWNHMSNTHVSRVKSFIEEVPKKIKPFFGDMNFKIFLKRLIIKTDRYYDMLNNIPIYDSIITKLKILEPVLKQKTILYIFKYVYIKIIEIYIDTCNEFSEELELEQVNEFKNKVGMFIFAILNNEIDDIKMIDVNYEYIMKKVKSQKEKEKQEITDELYEIDQNPILKELEFYKKKYKNDGRWAIGSKKELVQYGKNTYDRETAIIQDMNSYLNAEINEYNDISMLGEDYSDGVDVMGMVED